jgi:hypothetical protein
MKQLISVFAIMAIMLSACTGNNKQVNAQSIADLEIRHEDADHHLDSRENMDHHNMEMGSGIEHHMDSSPMTVQKSRTNSIVIDAYLKIKNALVADNGKDATKAAKDLVNAFDNIYKSSIPAEKMSEVKEIIEDAREHADHISENQGNIEHQREHFEMLSIDIKGLIAVAGADRTLYQIYCPMYNNKKGGMWLSASNEIKNPLYGSKMLNCGEVKSKISIQ